MLVDNWNWSVDINTEAEVEMPAAVGTVDGEESGGGVQDKYPITSVRLTLQATCGGNFLSEVLSVARRLNPVAVVSNGGKGCHSDAAAAHCVLPRETNNRISTLQMVPHLILPSFLRGADRPNP